MTPKRSRRSVTPYFSRPSRNSHVRFPKAVHDMLNKSQGDIRLEHCTVKDWPREQTQRKIGIQVRHQFPSLGGILQNLFQLNALRFDNISSQFPAKFWIVDGIGHQTRPDPAPGWRLSPARQVLQQPDQV